jgi:hypothetical protein
VAVPDFAAAVFIAATSPLLATLPSPVAHAASSLVPLEVGKVPLRIRGSSISMIWPRRLERDPAHVWLRRAVLDSAGLALPLARERCASLNDLNEERNRALTVDESGDVGGVFLGELRDLTTLSQGAH